MDKPTIQSKTNSNKFFLPVLDPKLDLKYTNLKYDLCEKLKKIIAETQAENTNVCIAEYLNEIASIVITIQDLD